MADTQRTRAAILALFADNVTGQISPQDLRDFVVTIMETEFVNAGDVWKQPDIKSITADKTGKGWIDYSQIMHSDYSASFGMPLAILSASGVWVPADLSRSTANPALGIPLESYASGATTMQILRCGIIYDSGLSRFSGFLGKPIFLQSAATVNSASIDCTVGTSDSNVGILGIAEWSDDGGPVSYKWRFDPNWAVTGI